ncbi:MAG: hypothetical protein PT119_21395 [Aphanizomenon gracile PMC627.10]|nr:hypothetical protein [Aphanizomenon gracile PMC627.10]
MANCPSKNHLHFKTAICDLDGNTKTLVSLEVDDESYMMIGGGDAGKYIVPRLHDDEDAEDSLLMRLFLDFATTEALKDNTLQPYTTEMSEAAHKLIEGVQLEDE